MPVSVAPPMKEHSQEGAECEEVAEAEAAVEAIRGNGEIEADKDTPRPQHTPNLYKGCRDVSDVAETVAHGDDIERGLGEGEPLEVAFHELDRLESRAFVPRLRQHGPASVEAHNPRHEPRLPNQYWDRSSPRRKIEHALDGSVARETREDLG